MLDIGPGNGLLPADTKPLRETGLGFSRPKPVFPVQNGINWDKPAFSQFFQSETGKNCPKLEKIMENYISRREKLPKLC